MGRIGRTAAETGTATIGRSIRELRLALGLTQARLAREAGVSQTWVSAVERGRVARLRVATVERLLQAMGGRLTLSVDAPYLADRRVQRDAGHARCVEYTVGRLRRSGWRVETEVEVGSDRSRGWIDILAFLPATHVLLVIEVKTELHDLGAIQRQLGWYEREAWAAARRRGWRPLVLASGLLLLATRSVDQRVADNRLAFGQAFTGRAQGLSAIVAGSPPPRRQRHVAMIDPLSRRVDWLRPLRLDGRRTDAPYADYASFIRARHERAARRAGAR